MPHGGEGNKSYETLHCPLVVRLRLSVLRAINDETHRISEKKVELATPASLL